MARIIQGEPEGEEAVEGTLDAVGIGMPYAKDTWDVVEGCFGAEGEVGGCVEGAADAVVDVDVHEDGETSTMDVLLGNEVVEGVGESRCCPNVGGEDVQGVPWHRGHIGATCVTRYADFRVRESLLEERSNVITKAVG